MNYCVYSSFPWEVLSQIFLTIILQVWLICFINTTRHEFKLTISCLLRNFILVTYYGSGNWAVDA